MEVTVNFKIIIRMIAKMIVFRFRLDFGIKDSEMYFLYLAFENEKNTKTYEKDSKICGAKNNAKRVKTMNRKSQPNVFITHRGRVMFSHLMILTPI